MTSIGTRKRRRNECLFLSKAISSHSAAGYSSLSTAAFRLRRIDSSKGNGYPLTGPNSLGGEILKRRDRAHGAARRLARQLSPKLMPVPRSNLAADPLYYGPRSIAVRWRMADYFLAELSLYLRPASLVTGPWRMNRAVTDSCFELPFVGGALTTSSLATGWTSTEVLSVIVIWNSLGCCDTTKRKVLALF